MQGVMQGNWKKLSEDDLGAVLELAKGGFRASDIAEIYGVSRQCIHSHLIRRGVIVPQHRVVEPKSAKPKFVPMKDVTEKQKAERLRLRAWSAVYTAIKRGILVRQPCEQCGATTVEAHHDDYTRPLSVRWLCNFHHNEWHNLHGKEDLIALDKQKSKESEIQLVATAPRG